MTTQKTCVILFVEGDTEKEFFGILHKYYHDNSLSKLNTLKICNVKGIGRFESKVSSKLRHEIIPKFQGHKLVVACAYDTDVFELAQNPPTNWKVIRKKVAELGINEFHEIRAEKMIEDWFLKDIKGLCKFLKTVTPQKIEGKDGVEKMKKLFKRSNKLYLKGHYSYKFISDLDIPLIRKAIGKQVLALEKALGVNL